MLLRQQGDLVMLAVDEADALERFSGGSAPAAVMLFGLIGKTPEEMPSVGQRIAGCVNSGAFAFRNHLRAFDLKSANRRAVPAPRIGRLVRIGVIVAQDLARIFPGCVFRDARHLLFDDKTRRQRFYKIISAAAEFYLSGGIPSRKFCFLRRNY